jgi:hypothetical protein
LLSIGKYGKQKLGKASTGRIKMAVGTQMSTNNTNNKPDPKHWYTAAETAQFLGVKEQTVTDYCREGRIIKKGQKQGPKNRWHVQGSEIIRIQREWKLAG